MYKGIDVSKHNGILDWNILKDNIDFAMIRIGVGDDIKEQDDIRAEYNMSECERLGIPFGVYIYSYAISTEQAVSEANHCLRMTEGHNPTLGYWLDMEDSDNYKSNNGFNPYENRDLYTHIALAFLDIMSNNGLKSGIYANTDWFDNVLNLDDLDYRSKWLAHWGLSERPTECLIWQYTSDGYLPEHNCRFDMNYFYGEFSNELPDEELSENKYNELIENLVIETIQDKYGSGNKRINNLGVYYEPVQNVINQYYPTAKTIKDMIDNSELDINLMINILKNM